MRLTKNIFEKIALKYIIFLLLITIVPIIIGSMIIEGTNYYHKIQIVFKILKIYLLFGALIGLFIFLGKDKLKNFRKEDLESKIKLTIIGLIIILFSIIPFSNMNNFLSQNEIIVSEINQTKIIFEKNQIINPWFFEIETKLKEQFIDGNKLDENDYSKEVITKTITLRKIPKKPVIKWYGSWQGSLFNDKYFNNNIDVFLSINNNTYNITDQYINISEYQKALLKKEVSRDDFLIGENEIQIFTKNNGGIGENIIVLSQSLFYNYNSQIKKDNDYQKLKEELLIFIENDNNFLYKIFSETSQILRLIGLVITFIGFFGFNFIKKSYQNARKELLYSTIGIYLLGVFSIAIKSIESLLEQISSFLVYILLKISGFSAQIVLTPTERMVQLGKFLGSVGASSSGANHIILFIVAFNIFIFSIWKEIELKKIIKYQIIGVIGIFLINTLNLYIQTIANYYSKTESLFLGNYLPSILFILFFIIFWGVISNNIEKKENKEIKKKKNEKRKNN